MLTYINYLNNPLPTPSHSDAVYRDPFTYTLTGEGLFYSAQSTNRIHYDIYLSGALSETGEVDGSGFQRTFSGADIVVNYYGKNSSGTITTVKQSKFYYDAFAPILNEYIPNNLTQTGWSAQAVYTGASFS